MNNKNILTALTIHWSIWLSLPHISSWYTKPHVSQPQIFLNTYLFTTLWIKDLYFCFTWMNIIFFVCIRYISSLLLTSLLGSTPHKHNCIKWWYCAMCHIRYTCTCMSVVQLFHQKVKNLVIWPLLIGSDIKRTVFVGQVKKFFILRFK